MFQYILCVGSSKFNSVHSSLAFTFQYILCVGSRNFVLKYGYIVVVSIHPMCRFKYL